MTVAFITGANSGIGRAAAVDLAAKGWTVYGSMRSLDKGERLASMAADAGVEVTPVVCDVTDTDSVDRAVAEVTEAAGGIDVLVNNAGIAANGVLEESPVERYAEVMDVNLYGVVRCVQAVVPQMRERGSGCIVNISSVAGRIAALAQSPYVASKWAVEGLSEGLAQEVAPFGIRVVIVEPGVVKTAIIAKNVDAPNASGAYDRAYQRMFQFYGLGLVDPGHPSEVADVIYEAATTDDPKLRWTCGWGWGRTGREPAQRFGRGLGRPRRHRGRRRIRDPLRRTVRTRPAKPWFGRDLAGARPREPGRPGRGAEVDGARWP